MPNTPTILTLELEHADKVSNYEAASGSLLIGSGSHCDVRLLPEEAATEQLLVEARPGGIFVRTLTQDGTLRHEGCTFHEGCVDKGSTFTLGALQLRVGLRSAVRRSGAAGESVTQTLLLRGVLMTGIVIGLYQLAFSEESVDVLSQSVPTPALFAAHAAAACQVGDVRDAGFQAERWLLEAELKRERSPFSASDGIAGVRLYDAASACFRRAGRPREADRVQQTSAKLRAELADEFHVRHVRLERFLHLKRHDAAQLEVQALSAFVHDQDGPYVEWLGAVQRELNARFASAVRIR
jgi:hypothetical protein